MKSVPTRVNTCSILRSFCLLLSFFAPNLCAQTTSSLPGTIDTVRVMQYNLLNYGNSANSPYYKNARLATIVQYARPDVLGVNEVFSQPALLDSILAALGPGWAHAAYSNAGGETQTNSLFYKSSTFLLHSQTLVSSNLRDIIAYRLQYRDALTAAHDTVFLTVIVCHLKASPGSAEEAERAVETATIAAYIAQSGSDNYLVMGDMNVYSSTEAAYQNLVANPTLSARLYDPISRPGAWSGNASFADIHTQSPRTVNTLGDGGASGGLDDRFDQILVSGPVIGDSAGVKYLPGSYQTVGQDGQHYNGSLLDAPGNTSAPAQVVQALYEMSDHLPVRADFVLHTVVAATGLEADVVATVPTMTVVNPIQDGWLDVRLGAGFSTVRMRLVDMDGRAVWRWTGDAQSGQLREWIGGDMPPGVYALIAESAAGRAVQRVVVR